MLTDRPLAFRIKALNNQIKRMLEKTALPGNDTGLTGMQFAFLGFLSEQDAGTNVYQRDLEAEFNIRRSTATGILQLMEKNGYIRRESVPEDARLKKIITTDKAKEIDTFAKENIMRLETQLTRGISPKEMDQFYQTLEKIADNAQS